MWVGVDPGGERSFGVAVIGQNNENVETSVVSSTDEAIDFIRDTIADNIGALQGVGVDAPLWWSSGKAGARTVDTWIRSRYRLLSGTVQTANSLRGACLVQGMMFAYRLRQWLPHARVTEAHPKAVAAALGGWGGNRVKILSPVPLDAGNEHCRGAVMAAISAREGFMGRWRDLTQDSQLERAPGEMDPKTDNPLTGPVSYFWPFD